MEKPKRLLLYVNYDRDHRVDDHVLYQLRHFAPLCSRVVFISNSGLRPEDRAAVAELADEIIVRENRGFDFGAWAEVLLRDRADIQAAFDELLLMNGSCYGPLFPPAEMFESMAKEPCDFWGITTHPPLGRRVREHLQSYFLLIRRPMLASAAFWNFWPGVADRCADFTRAVRHGEIAFSTAMRRAGFRFQALVDPADRRENPRIGFRHPLSFFCPDWLIRRCRLPLLKVKAFRHHPISPVSRNADIMRAIGESGSDYPVGLIEAHLRRTAPLSWRKNLASTLLTIPEDAPPVPPSPPPSVAVFLHLYYLELLDEFLQYLGQMPVAFDLFVTTPHEGVEARLAASDFRPARLERLTVRIAPNRGRDIGPWLCAFSPEEHLRYDVALKLHTKTSPTDTEFFGWSWRRFLLDSLLASPGYVAALLGEFAREPKLGTILPVWPPAVVLQCPEAFAGTPADRELARQLMTRLALRPPEETDQPVFAAGTMFWYRPAALEKLFRSGLAYEDFPSEPIGNVGTLAHAIERQLPYIAQGGGFDYRQAMPSRLLREAFRTYEDRSTYTGVTLSRAAKTFGRALLASMAYRFGKLFGREL
jgi:rhamnosyltransferase